MNKEDKKAEINRRCYESQVKQINQIKQDYILQYNNKYI